MALTGPVFMADDGSRETLPRPPIGRLSERRMRNEYWPKAS